MPTSRLKKLTDAVARPFRRKPAAPPSTPGRPPPTAPKGSVREVVLEAVARHYAFEQQHHVPFEKDQRLRSIRQHVALLCDAAGRPVPTAAEIEAALGPQESP